MNQKTILLAISGSIAAYKTPELIRNLIKKNYRVQVLVTENALRFVTKLTLETLSEEPIYSTEWEMGMQHIDLKNKASLFAIVPATANIISKLAVGMADDLVSSTYLALDPKTPRIIAPAMNPNMYNHIANQRNLKTLKEDGVTIITPEHGMVLCGDEGQGKMANIEIIEKIIIENLTHK